MTSWHHMTPYDTTWPHYKHHYDNITWPHYDTTWPHYIITITSHDPTRHHMHKTLQWHRDDSVPSPQPQGYCWSVPNDSWQCQSCHGSEIHSESQWSQEDGWWYLDQQQLVGESLDLCMEEWEWKGKDCSAASNTLDEITEFPPPVCH